jgi:3-deoxy-D-manno-octulosonic-acid transferase
LFAFFYNLFVQAALVLVRGVALFHAKTRRWWAGQRQFETLPKNSKKYVGRTAWFHAASLGEFEQGRPVIEAFRARYPHFRVVLTFFSPSGYEVQKNYSQADWVLYLPADTPANVRAFLDVVQPDVAFFIKYEFWYNYLTQLRQRGVPVLLFSAIFRPEQLFFKPYGGFYREMLFCFEQILVQDDASQKLLESIDYKNVHHAGDTRLDRVVQIAQQARQIPIIADFKKDAPLLIVGSAWPDDMAVLIPFLNQFSEPLKVVIAPHEINPAQIENWQAQLHAPSVRWSQLDNQDTTTAEARYLFLDTIGLLSASYRYADFAFVGGAYGDGLHNILEPAAFGMPLFFGHRYYHKFQEAVDLIQQNAAHAVANAQELEDEFQKIYQDSALRQNQAETCRRYVQAHSGATERVMDAISSLL